VNVTAPHPVRNEEFTRVLANALHRPALAIAPALAIRVMYGEMGIETVVAGQKVLPRVLTESGFAFTFPELAGALERELSPS
jgi:NAD dependent epimerase/dehydratase family enzyme